MALGAARGRSQNDIRAGLCNSGGMGFDSGNTLAERFRSHAGHDRTLYGFAMRGMADDWEAGGVVREICAGWEDAPPGRWSSFVC